MKIEFTPDDTIQGDLENAVKLLSSGIKSHENGLPEWAKNASDAYMREAVPDAQRIIVLIFHQKTSKRVGSIACLDFVGMTRERIENNFRRWADPHAYLGDSRQDFTGGQGGHGNGGKSYMIQMFEECSWFLTVRGSRGNKYGFLPGKPRPGYFPSPDQSRDFLVQDREGELGELLSILGCKVADLPSDAKRVIQERDGFTCVAGFGPRGRAKRISVKRILEALLGHPQMFQTLQLCRIYAIEDGKPLNDGAPLQLPEIEPMEDAAEPKEIPIPDKLIDPRLEEEVSTTDGGEEKPGYLVLRTSRVNMRVQSVSTRWSLRARHNVIYKAKGKYLGQVDMHDLNQSAYGDRIYGECYLDSLAPYITNTRDHPSDSPLTRAVEDWIRQQVDSYAKEFVRLERLRPSQEVKDELQRMNQALDEWKNQFLAEIGIGPGVKPPPPPPTPPLPRRLPAKLSIFTKHSYAGREVTFKPRIEFYDQNGERVAACPYAWRSSDWEVATVDEDALTIRTHQPGRVELWAESLIPGVHGINVKSNRLIVEVLDTERLEVVPGHVSIRAGGFANLTAVAILRNQDRKEGVFVEWIDDDPAIATVSSAGVVYGVSRGSTNVFAGEAHCISEEVPIEILDPLVGTQGYPQIRLSDIDEDPLDPGVVPHWAPEEGPVCQPKPQYVDANIWWINMSSPLARRYLDEARGHGPRSPQWRVYLLERYIEVLVKIKLSHAFRLGEELPYPCAFHRTGPPSLVLETNVFFAVAAFTIGQSTAPCGNATR
jgi:hypothetical protein